jgi:hypothetical protein
MISLKKILVAWMFWDSGPTSRHLRNLRKRVSC